MRLASIPPHVWSRTIVALIVAVLVGAAACARSEDGVTISGDVEGLDTIALRGDSLVASARGAPINMDSLRAVADGRIPTTVTKRLSGKTAGRSVTDAGKAPVRPVTDVPGLNPMTLRAQARGDSMARAAALRHTSGSGTGRSGSDTVRGIVTLVGAEPAKQVVLKTMDGKRTIAMSGMVTTGMSRLVGLELQIRGVMITPRDVVVADYVVRAVNGVPAYDGKLASDGNGPYLLLTDGTGRKRVATLPASLQGQEGARVWIAMKSGAGVASTSGVIGRR